ncbi:MAG: polyribonucleotide nucleotidyltransferase [Planctomycetota bacterium]
MAASERSSRKPSVGVHSVERVIGGIPLTISTGLMAKQADGACVVTYGGTMVLVAAQSATLARDVDFFPLTVEYREKVGAAGKIPGGFIKREGRPSQKEILTMRVIDRTMRPLFPEGFRDEVQIFATVVSADPYYDPDALAMVGAGAALHLSRIPFWGAAAGVRVGLVDGQYVVNPTHEQLETSRLDLIVAGHRDAVTMVEAAATDVSEEEMLGAIEVGHQAVKEIADMIDELRSLCGVPKMELPRPEPIEELVSELRREYGQRIIEAMLVQGKHAKAQALSAVTDEIMTTRLAGLCEDDPERQGREKTLRNALSEVLAAEERAYILQHRRRTDLRGPEDIRPISIEVGLLPRCHGSALFTRGETQALVSATLGTAIDAQRVDGLRDQYVKRFMLDYNFPPFCVGEVRPVRGPGRREIGHGSLAERAITSVLPPQEEFAYTIRVVSDILESNGSSSMATVCGAVLALFDAGVRLRRAVAGIAMGLVREGAEVCILSDIQGSEDHHGDMDFKVAGTAEGITALQMDIKATGVSAEVMRQALDQARSGRLHILEQMSLVMPGPREHLSPYAPRLLRIVIPVDKIGVLIGPGGRTIKALQEKTGATIEVEDDGTVMISGKSDASVEEALTIVEGLTSEVELDKVYEGTVVSLKEFGAFIEILPGQEGLLHVSELGPGFVRHVEDVLNVGDRVKVRVINIDPSGRVKLSRRGLEPEPGEEGSEGEREPRSVPAAPERDVRRESRPRGERSGGRERPRGGREQPAHTGDRTRAQRGGSERGGGGRERGRGRGRERDRDWDRGSERYRDRDRDSDRHRASDRPHEGDRDRDRDSDRYRERDREPDRDRDRDSDRPRPGDRPGDADRYRERDRDRGGRRQGERSPVWTHDARDGREEPERPRGAGIEAEPEPEEFDEQPVRAQPSRGDEGRGGRGQSRNVREASRDAARGGGRPGRRGRRRGRGGEAVTREREERPGGESEELRRAEIADDARFDDEPDLEPDDDWTPLDREADVDWSDQPDDADEPGPPERAEGSESPSRKPRRRHRRR